MTNLKNFNYLPQSILIILIPVFLIFSRFLLEVTLLFITLSFLFFLKKKKEFIKLIFFKKYTFFFLIFFLFLLLSFIFSDFKKESITILFYFRFYLYFISLIFFFVYEKKLINYFLFILALTFIILFFDSLLQYFYGNNLFGYKNSEIHRITSFFNDEQILGSFVSKTLVFLLIAKVNIDRTTKKNFLINLALIASPIIIFLSGERASLLTFFIMMIYFSLFFFREKIFKSFYFFLFFIIFFITVFLLNSKTYYERYITQTINSFIDISYSQNRDLLPDDVKNNYNFYFLSAQHQNYMITSLNIFKQNKFLGSGPKTYRHICSDDKIKINYYSCGTHPHNYYLQFIAEMGIIGIFIITFLYFHIIKKSIINFIFILKNKKTNILQIIILGHYTSQFWPITQTGNFFNNYNSIMLLLPLSIYISILLKKKIYNDLKS